MNNEQQTDVLEHLEAFASLIDEGCSESVLESYYDKSIVLLDDAAKQEAYESGVLSLLSGIAGMKSEYRKNLRQFQTMMNDEK